MSLSARAYKPGLKAMTFYRFWWWLAYVLAALLFRLRVEGRKNIPQAGGVILAGNHCGLVDPIIIGVAAGRELWYLAKAELFSVPVVGSLIRRLHAMPVDRNRGDRGALAAWEQQLTAGCAILLFPEGTRNKSRQLLKPKLGVGMLVYRTRVPVVPVHISGTENIWTTLLGVARIQVRFGESISFEESPLSERRKDAYDFISNEVMRKIACLRRRRREAGTTAPASTAQQRS